MFEFIRAHQLNMMLVLCGACAIIIFLLINTRFLAKSRRLILIQMETVALFLLWFDRMAYIYAGDVSRTGYVMVRLSNFMVFFLTSGVVLSFSLYLMDYLKTEGKMEKLPRRLQVTSITASLGLLLAVFSAFTDLYYYFDETNTYHRGDGFLIAYVIPILCPIIQYTIIRQYKKVFSKLIYISMVLYLFVPLGCGILQIFTYGISIVNMAMVAVSICLYIFTYLDLNNTVEHAHQIELDNMQGEKLKLEKLFYQTAMSFVSAIEKKDESDKGRSIKTAEYARSIAMLSGKNEEECDRVYYSALLHDVGKIGIPDEVIRHEDDPDEEEIKVLKQKPVIGKEILSSITEYPYLSQGAYSCYEKYDGTGYPEGLKGEDIPEIARIVSVADSYVSMSTRRPGKDPLPDFVAREAFIKGAGADYDPEFSNCMIKIIDSNNGENAAVEYAKIEKELTVHEYREKVTAGILADRNVKKISFKCDSLLKSEEGFTGPAIILFDSYDARVHTDEKSIDTYKYYEYGEIWFDDHMVSTNFRKVEVTKDESFEDRGDGKYEVILSRFEDHIKLVMNAPDYSKEMTIALFDKSRTVFIALTGENCELKEIEAEATGDVVAMNDIERIAEEIDFLDHMESDIRNIQIDRPRSGHTEGVPVEERLKLSFHTMSLPAAELVWHCPYIVLYSSADGKVDGPDYHEYALVKLYGENEGKYQYSENNIVMKRTDEFPGWDGWKEKNKKGYECRVSLVKKGNKITLETENVGVYVENTTTINEEVGKVYVSLTGDQVALTDIRVI